MSVFSFSCNIFALKFYYFITILYFYSDMKLKNYIFLLPFLILALVGCKDDDSNTPAFTSESGFKLILPYDIHEGNTLTFTASDNWVITNADNSKLSLSQTSGKAGVNNILIKPKEYNRTNDSIRYSFTITTSDEGTNKDIDVELIQEPVFIIKTLNYDAAPEGETLHIRVKSKADLSPYSLRVYTVSPSDFDDMISTWNAKEESQLAEGKLMISLDSVITRSKISEDEAEVNIIIKPNTTSHMLKGAFCFCIDDNINIRSEYMTVVQPAVDTYCSKDMKTGDRIVTQLQEHKLGNGVPIVILGDGFLDRDIADGKFRKATNKAIDALFSMQPMNALRDYFDVYEVTAVSFNDYCSPTSITAFNSKFACIGSSEIRGDNLKALEYAKLAVDKERIDDATIIILVNENQYGGTTTLYTDEPKMSDIPNGCGIAYIPLYENKKYPTIFNTILNHEAVGHGFAKLADEYNTGILGKLTDSYKELIDMAQMHGGYRNIALNSDVTKSYWANFAADSRYKSEHLGCYEGGADYTLGVYRPTENSIMNTDFEDFNVAGRVQIYKRCMSTAFGNSWKYNEADFIAFDLENKAKASTKRNAPAKRTGYFRPLAAPKVTIMKTAK